MVSTRTSSSVKAMIFAGGRRDAGITAAEMPGRRSEDHSDPGRPFISPGNGSSAGIDRRLSTRMNSTFGYSPARSRQGDVRSLRSCRQWSARQPKCWAGRRRPADSRRTWRLARLVVQRLQSIVNHVGAVSAGGQPRLVPVGIPSVFTDHHRRFGIGHLMLSSGIGSSRSRDDDANRCLAAEVLATLGSRSALCWVGERTAQDSDQPIEVLPTGSGGADPPPPGSLRFQGRAWGVAQLDEASHGKTQ